ncbi:MAG: RsmG family class I SAM-dependent methyltransferase [Pseudomonadota bacterium]
MRRHIDLRSLDTPQAVAAAFGFSAAVGDRLAAFDRVFMEAAEIHNLVARSTLPDRFARHYADSLQLAAFIPESACTHVDLGSGAGFPGLVLAAALSDRGLKTRLVESTGKKAAFLAQAADAMGLDVVLENARIESLAPAPADIVTARALAPLEKLFGYVAPFCGPETVALLPKGQDVAAELTEAAKSWMYEIVTHPSVTNADAAILEVRNLASRALDRPEPHSRRRQSKGRRR